MNKPTYNGNVITFHARYCLWYNLEKQTKIFNPLDHICYFAQQMKNDTRYTEIVQQMIQECPLETKKVPKQYKLEQLAQTLLGRYMANNNDKMDIFNSDKDNDYQISAAEADKPAKKDSRKDRKKSQRQNIQQEDVQCQKCKLYGHRASNCNLFGQIYWCLQYYKTHREEAIVAANVYHENNTPTAKAAQKA